MTVKTTSKGDDEMAKRAPVVLSLEERSVLKSWVRSGTTERRMAERAGMMLRLAEGQSSVAWPKR